MDRAIYTAMSGARLALDRQAVVSNNLAQVNTAGFRAQMMATQSATAAGGDGSGFQTRVSAMAGANGFDARTGTIRETGRPLDFALTGEGWFAVQDSIGAEAYTRNGAFVLSPDGNLMTSSGQMVLGEGGPISVPANGQLEVASDGRVTSTIQVEGRPQTTEIARLKLVNPDPSSLSRGPDGLFRLAGGGQADADPKVRLTVGALEGSNVSVVNAMVDMISLGRSLDLQMNLLKKIEENDARSSQMLSLG